MIGTSGRSECGHMSDRAPVLAKPLEELGMTNSERVVENCFQGQSATSFTLQSVTVDKLAQTSQNTHTTTIVRGTTVRFNCASGVHGRSLHAGLENVTAHNFASPLRGCAIAALAICFSDERPLRKGELLSLLAIICFIMHRDCLMVEIMHNHTCGCGDDTVSFVSLHGGIYKLRT
eukprot:5223874-Amphidinium_carterae.1